MRGLYTRTKVLVAIALLGLPVTTLAQSDDAGLAQELTNPDISNSFMQPFLAYTWPSA